AGGQVNLPADVDRGTVAVVPDGESKLHHRHRLPVLERCACSLSWWDLGSGGDDSGTATETPPCPCGPARRSPGILLAAQCPACALLVPPSAAVSADRVAGWLSMALRSAASVHHAKRPGRAKLGLVWFAWVVAGWPPGGGGVVAAFP